MSVAPSEEFLLAILPYLKTSRPISIRVIIFRPARDAEPLSGIERDALNSLLEMFVLRHSPDPQSTVYACTPLQSEGSVNAETLLQALRTAQTYITYLYASPHPSSGEPFLPTETSSLYLFQPARVPHSLAAWPRQSSQVTIRTPEGSMRWEVEGFTGLLNWHRHLWVAEGSQIFPPVPHLS